MDEDRTLEQNSAADQVADRKFFRGLVAGFAGFVLILVALHWYAFPTLPPADKAASIDDLIYELRLQGVRAPAYRDDLLRVAVVGSPPPSDVEKLTEVLETYGRIAGLGIEMSSKNDEAELLVEFVNPLLFDRSMREYRTRRGNFFFSPFRPCYESRRPNADGPTLIFLPQSGDAVEREYCIWHTLAHQFGLGHVNRAFASVLHYWRELPRATLNDLVLLRAIHDPRVRAGMSEEQLARFLPTLLRDLIARAEGAADPVSALAQR